MEDPFFKEKNYWALILGGSSGIGWATAKKMAEQGMNICIVHRDRRKGQLAFEKRLNSLDHLDIEILTFNIDALRSDKSHEAIITLKKVLGEHGKIRLLVHAISRGNLKLMTPLKNQSETLSLEEVEGIENYTLLDNQIKETYAEGAADLTASDFNNTINAMAISLYEWTKRLLEYQLFAEDTRIIGLTSEGSKKAWRSYAAVSAAKASLEAICRSIALEFASYGIRCNIVQPGVTVTPSLKMIPGHEHLIGNALIRNPFKRLTQPEDVANVIFLLSRPEAAWINGAIIPVDGGEGNS